MVPGGSDFTFRFGRYQMAWARQFITHALMDHWPQALVVTDDKIMSHLYEVPFGQIDEFFIYQDGDWLKYIEKNGVDEKATGRMVHVISDSDEITMVCERCAPITSVIARVHSYLSNPANGVA